MLARNTALTALIILLFAGGFAAFLKLQFLGTTHSGDYDTYILTAQYIAGGDVDPTDLMVSQRLLKPLYPALLAVLSNVTDFYSASVAQSVVFYLLFIVAMFLLAREFFEETFPAVLAVLLTAGQLSPSDSYGRNTSLLRPWYSPL
ncbi:MAG: hypothetical protein UY63_C0016G0015 [Parcubacteria group bacterium GW2011_GWA2_51_10]|nr:MAG: hypothetical protein UY63_C0016G0015 [Parcubacteria group bacterium GW2011_GWA2_51_10]